MTSNAFPAESITELIDALGSEEFIDILWNQLHSEFPIRHISCVRFHQVDRFSEISALDQIFWRSDFPEEEVSRAYDDYSQNHWRHDPILRFLTDLDRGSSILVHVKLPNVNAPNYQEIMGASAPTDECTLARRAYGGVLCLGLYRDKGQAELTLAHLSRLKVMSNLIMSLIEKHWRLTQGKVLKHIKLPDIATMFSERLAVEGLNLSEQEFKSCIAFLEGTAIPQIAEQLGVRASSVRTYLGRAYDKIGARSRSELYQWSVSNALRSANNQAPPS